VLWSGEIGFPRPVRSAFTRKSSDPTSHSKCSNVQSQAKSTAFMTTISDQFPCFTMPWTKNRVKFRLGLWKGVRPAARRAAARDREHASRVRRVLLFRLDQAGKDRGAQAETGPRRGEHWPNLTGPCTISITPAEQFLMLELTSAVRRSPAANRTASLEIFGLVRKISDRPHRQPTR